MKLYDGLVWCIILEYIARILRKQQDFHNVIDVVAVAHYSTHILHLKGGQLETL